MKKNNILWILVCLIVLISMFNIQALAYNVVPETIATYETYNTNTIPSTWSSAPVGSVAEVTYDMYRNNSALQIVTNSTNPQMLYYSPASAISNGKVIAYEFKIKYDTQQTVTTGDLFTINPRGSNGSLTISYVTRDQKIQFTTGDPTFMTRNIGYSFAKNKWHTLKYVFKTDTVANRGQQYDVYLNNVLILQNQNFLAAVRTSGALTVSDIKDLYFGRTDSYILQNTNIQIDDVKITEINDVNNNVVNLEKYRQNFESNSTSSWVGSVVAPTIIQYSQPNSEEQQYKECLRIRDTVSSATSLTLTNNLTSPLAVSGDANELVAEFKLRYENGTANRYNKIEFLDSSSRELANMSFTNGLYSYQGTSSNLNMTMKEWYTFKLVFNVTSKTYSLYRDGVLVQSGMSFANISASDFKTMRVNLSYNVDFCFDNLKVYIPSQSFDATVNYVTDSSGNAINNLNSINIGSNATLRAKATISNTTRTNRQATIILAWFNGDKLMGVTTETQAVNAGSTSEISIPSNKALTIKIDSDTVVKSFVWSDMRNIILLVKASEVNVPFQVGPLISNNMVLQRDASVPIYGTASNNTQISVEFNGQTKSTIAQNGKWMVKLDSMQGGYTARNMTITSSNSSGVEVRTITNIVIGDVWLGSGQSNMDLNVYQTIPGTTVITPVSGVNSNVRCFKEGVSTDESRTVASYGTWATLSSTNAGWYSALMFYFAKDLQPTIDVPIGIIQSSWGGTGIESWMNPATFGSTPDFSAALAAYNTQTSYSPSSDPAAARNIPGKLFTTMIKPLIPYAIKGAVWYQGENNVQASDLYVKQLSSMILDWRASWGQGNLPFYIIQLPGYKSSGYPLMRMAQAKVAETITDTELIVTIDTGDYENIHPVDKSIVGQRLSILARKLTYGQNIPVYKSPEYLSKTISGNSITIDFKDIGSGLVATDANNVPGFEIAGNDGVYYSATAVLSNNKVAISNVNVSNPTKIKYAQTAWPQVALKNIEGFPVAPFITN